MIFSVINPNFETRCFEKVEQKKDKLGEKQKESSRLSLVQF
jgi:hypothetical protein